jgi:transcriptional regulator with XRE-family HTH domain
VGEADVQVQERPAGVPERAAARFEPPWAGERLRQRRLALDVSVRELARRLALSPSLISQIERGKASPSVATLYAWTTELGLSMDALFSQREEAPAPRRRTTGSVFAEVLSQGREATPRDERDPVVHPQERDAIRLASGVRWERLNPASDPDVDHLYVVYQPGGASCEPDALMRHPGHEYGYLISGTLEVTLGFETHALEAGDAISFSSTVPHRLACVGGEPVHAIWCVVGRRGAVPAI